MALPALDPSSPELARCHLLVLPDDVATDEVSILATSRFPRATWETRPGSPGASSRGRTGRSGSPAGLLRLSRHSTLEGPYALDRAAVLALGLPAASGQAYLVHAPVERGPEPWPTGGDRDGLRRAFPGGLPVRDEERTVAWLVAAARRLGGAVLVAPGAPREGTARAGHGTLLVPDPAAAVDLTVWSDVWLEPDAALVVMRQAVPRAVLNLPVASYKGPPPGTGLRKLPGTDPLTLDMRKAIHARADEVDLAALTAPPPMEAYGALADLEVDGMVVLEVGAEAEPPPAVAAVPWAAQGAVAYRVRWEPDDVVDAEAERPSPAHRVARGRVTPLVVAITRAVHGAVGGEITDAMAFVVDPADL